jgi:hypothetical protein
MGVFPRPVAYAALGGRAVGVPGTTAGDRCAVVGRGVWDGFLDLSLWVEALSIHEWSLFTESVAHPGGAVVRRGDVYTLLTDRPDNRRPLDWERNQVDLLLMEGRVFERPWTGRPLRATATWAARRPSSCPTAGCSRRITLRTSMECRMFLAQPSPVRSHAPWPG